MPPSLVEFLEDRQIGVKWNRPPCRGDPITMYELQRNPVGKTWESMGNWKTELRTKNMFYCVPNLLPATSHGFRVRAHNSLGWGEFGTPCQSIRTESDVPSQPSAPYMISWNGTVVSIAWTHKGRIALDNKEDNGKFTILHFFIFQIFFLLLHTLDIYIIKSYIIFIIYLFFFDARISFNTI